MKMLSCFLRPFSAVYLLLSLLILPAVIASAEPVVQGYTSDQNLQKGIVVMYNKKDPTKVEPASPDNLTQLKGVIVDPNDAPITLTKENQKVFVATSGQYPVLVSSQNGVINKGDYLSVSSFQGIAAKATERQLFVLGKALQSFDGKTNTVATIGNYAVARIQVDIQVGKSPIVLSDSNFLPDFLRKAGQSVAGKPVSTARLYTALGLLLVSSLIAGTLLYGGVRSAIISVGRNPLGKKTIIRGLIQVVIFGITVLIIGVIGVYLLLNL